MSKFYQSPKQISPGKVVNCILFMANSSRNYLSINVVMQLLPQTTFNWEWFIQKLQKIKLVIPVTTKRKPLTNHYAYGQSSLFNLLVEALFGIMNKNDSFPMLIILWSTCTTHHLQDICDGKIYISFCFSIIKLCSLQ